MTYKYKIEQDIMLWIETYSIIIIYIRLIPSLRAGKPVQAMWAVCHLTHKKNQFKRIRSDLPRMGTTLFFFFFRGHRVTCGGTR